MYPGYATPPGAPGGLVSGARPALAGQPLAQTPSSGRPVFRAKGPDDPVPPPVAPAPVNAAPLILPSPEQLGIARSDKAAPAAVDWTAARRRLDQVGATCFHLEKLTTGGYRFTCLLPTAQAGRNHHVEAVAASEAEVVRLALEQSEQWAANR
jgi:hypothetical protein